MIGNIKDPEDRIAAALSVAYQREQQLGSRRGLHADSKPMTIAEIFEEAPSDGPDELAIKCETAIRLLLFFFQEGCHPGCVMRLVYLTTQRLRPELILNMSGAELADMFGETRAAWSARNKRMFSGYLKSRSGAKAVKGRGQKSETASLRYAQAAKGNTNRRGKTKIAA